MNKKTTALICKSPLLIEGETIQLCICLQEKNINALNFNLIVLFKKNTTHYTFIQNCSIWNKLSDANRHIAVLLYSISALLECYIVTANGRTTTKGQFTRLLSFVGSVCCSYFSWNSKYNCQLVCWRLSVRCELALTLTCIPRIFIDPGRDSLYSSSIIFQTLLVFFNQFIPKNITRKK